MIYNAINIRYTNMQICEYAMRLTSNIRRETERKVDRYPLNGKSMLRTIRRARHES